MNLRNALLAAPLGLALTAPAAVAQPIEQTLSVQSYQDEIPVTAETLTCFFTPGNSGSYIPRDTSWASLRLPTDELPVLTHAQASVTVESDQLCGHVRHVLALAAQNGGKLTVDKTVTLKVVKYPNAYSRTCQQYLQETVAVRLPHGVAVQSDLYKDLQDLPLRNCR